MDAICLSPGVDVDALRESVSELLSVDGYQPLASIGEVLLEPMMEWCLPSERCVTVTEIFASDGGNWQIVYDTQFSTAQLADALSREFPDQRIIQFNLQEEVDLTLRVLHGDGAIFEYSNAPSYFNWGRCLGRSEAERLARIDIPAFIEALGRMANAEMIKGNFATVAAKTLGTRKGPKGKHSGGVYDAMQAIASEAGLPRLYRFFEGWMKSDLDWDEDNVAAVFAFRKTGL
ncbi:MAG TPA: hypothetical protein VEK08_04640 [Planctomycetota bacterium]|nr:hypothetical protein [Planctomycetota bacterium]